MTSTTTSSSSRRSLLSQTIAIAVSTFALPPSSIPPSSGGRVVVDPLRLPPSFAAIAAETVGKDADCDDASCLGVWDGLLAHCPHPPGRGGGGWGGAGCVSSQDDAPGIFAEPWDYSDDVPLIPSSSSSSSSSKKTAEEEEEEDKDARDDYAKRMDRLILALDTTSRERGDSVAVLVREGRYLRAFVVDGVTGEGSVCEFYFTPDDTTVQFRLGSTTTATTTTTSTTTTTTRPPVAAARSVVVASFGTLVGRRSLTNADRSERIRGALRYAKVPVLRNRRRRFVFVESDSLDGFGPGSGMLGPPEEMSPGEVMMEYGRGGGRQMRTRRGSDDVDPRMRIDWVESFPVRRPGGG
ncbi:hypothetical protein ACHAW5_001370 [Stephanodiscus triporus]|uniref:Uncharacterized protein n=1 Tax=Stephanodiscus triporus TaxID=2934178 RepID=A0ABD3QDU1_9STRA